MLFVVPLRPLRLLGFILLFAIGRGAAHGDWQVLVILSVCVALLWGRDLLEAVKDVREGLYQARVWLEWTWDMLFR